MTLDDVNSPESVKFTAFFDRIVPYPDICDAVILPLNTLYSCVSGRSLLNTMLPYAGDYISAYVVACRHGWHDVLDTTIDILIPRPGDKSDWQARSYTTRDAAYAELMTHDHPFHYDLSTLGDEVMVLKRHSSGVYWFFNVTDVSMQCIGRFATEQSEEAVKQLFDAYAMEHSLAVSCLEVPEEPRPLPAKFFRMGVYF